MSKPMSQASKEERAERREIVKLRTELVETRAELIAMREVMIQSLEIGTTIPEEAVKAMIHGLSRRLSLGFMASLE